MKEKNGSTVTKRVREELPQATQPAVKKPYHEPVLTRHEQLLENTLDPIGGGSNISGLFIDPFGGG